MRLPLLLLLTLLTIGCVGPDARYHTTKLPGNRVEAMKSFYVVNREGDRRNIEHAIAEQFIALGYEATSGASPPNDPSQYDAVVTYIERYTWDMSPYCIQLTLYLEDTRTGYITATGSSWRPSIIRKTPAGHAKLLLTELLGAES